MKEPLFPLHTATLLQYIGIGLISGAISHGFFSGFRSFITAVIGIIIFVIGLMYERRLAGSKIDIGRVLLIGIIFSISTAMVAGGFQHFLDSPWRSAWIIPVGYLISLLAFREKEGIKNSFFNTLNNGVVITLLIFIIAFPLASITPAQFDNHHASEIDIRNKPKDDKHTMMMDHGSMVKSEESFIVNMIPHHQEAIDTARLIIEKGENTELKKLAQNIIDAQTEEITIMNGWLRDWNYSTIKPSYENMMGDGASLSGKALDTWFIHGMIMHHEGALQMAEAVLKLNPRIEVVDFANAIIKAQTKEITVMRSILSKN